MPDPRVALVAFVSSAVWIGTVSSLPGSLGWAIGCLALFLWARAVHENAVLPLRPAIAGATFAGLVTLLFYLLFSPERGVPLTQIGPIILGRDALLAGIRMVLRLTAFVILSLVLLTLCPPLGLAAGLTRMLLPLRRLRLRVTEFYYLTFFLARMAPLLIEESRVIRLAQESRAPQVRSGLITRLRHAPSLVVPVLAAGIRRSDRLACALEARGFSTDGVPPAVGRLRVSTSDYLLLALLLSGWCAWLYLWLKGPG